jgi:pumilio RNA-binding family
MHGSRFIQQLMETATEEEKADIFAEIKSSAANLMSDLFGNYVVQKFFEFGNSHQISLLCSLLRGNVVTLSFQTYGCRVVQKAIENLPREEQVSVIVELEGHVIDCVMDQNGNHVIQKCFECVSPTYLDFIIDAFEGGFPGNSSVRVSCRAESSGALQCCTVPEVTGGGSAEHPSSSPGSVWKLCDAAHSGTRTDFRQVRNYPPTSRENDCSLAAQVRQQCG